MTEYRCRAGHALPIPPPSDPNITNCLECGLRAAATGILPSEVVTSCNAVRRAGGGGAIYKHQCGGEVLVWDIISDGLLILECDCGNDPLTLASDLGIDHARLRPVELRIAARMREKKPTRKETPA